MHYGPINVHDLDDLGAFYRSRSCSYRMLSRFYFPREWRHCRPVNQETRERRKANRLASPRVRLESVCIGGFIIIVLRHVMTGCLAFYDNPTVLFFVIELRKYIWKRVPLGGFNFWPFLEIQKQSPVIGRWRIQIAKSKIGHFSVHKFLEHINFKIKFTSTGRNC
jgi:hypothetical protein